MNWVQERLPFCSSGVGKLGFWMFSYSLSQTLVVNAPPCLPPSRLSVSLASQLLRGFMRKAYLFIFTFMLIILCPDNSLPFLTNSFPLSSSCFGVTDISLFTKYIHWIESFCFCVHYDCCLRVSDSQVEKGTLMSLFYHENQRSVFW